MRKEWKANASSTGLSSDWGAYRLTRWQAEKLVGWQTDGLTRWQTVRVKGGRLTGRQSGKLWSSWQIERLSSWMQADKLANCLADIITGEDSPRLTSRQASWWTKISRGWQIDKLTRCQADKLIGWQTDMLTSWPTIRVIDGLSDRLPIWQVSGWQIERVSEGCRLANWQVGDRTVWLSKWQTNTCTS